MPGEPPAAEGKAVWWGGHPLVGRRALTDDEVRELRQVARGMRARGCAGCMVAPVAFFGGLALLAGTSFLDQDSPGAGAVILVFIVGIAVLVLTFGTLWERSRRLGQDIRARQVEIYEILAPPQPSLDGGAEGAGSSERLPDSPQPAEPPRFCEVLPHSGAVWSADDDRALRWPQAPRAETAAPPDPAAYVVWSPAEPDASGVDHQWSHREMTAAEVEEIRRHRWERLRTALLPAILVNLLAAPGLIHVLSGAGEIEPVSSWLWFVFMMLFFNALLVARWLEARRHLQDIHVGRIVLVQACMGTNTPPDDNRPPTVPADPAPITEYLPISRELWTEHGRPAGWRVSKPN